MKLIFSFLFLLATTQVHAQERTVETQRIAWMGYYQKLQLSPQWSVHTELEGRWFTTNMRQHQRVMPRMHVHYLTKGGADLGLGATYFLHFLPQNDEPLALIRPERRAHQELALKQPLGKSIRLEHRYRLEERFIQKVEKNILLDAWDYSWRFRYRVQLVVPLLPNTKVDPSLKIYDELLVQAGKSIQNNIFDQNRIGATLSLKLSKDFSTDMGYMHWFQQRPAGNAFYSRHIMRLTLSHNLSLSPKS